ncbi:unnamed protein product [Clonostachys rosea f. rosea IK726]|uniref:Uncharacterized protein n=1 Tax=Clonostachys rosea f. rosea IK726 TaxID=1349383 RepID=A0ACA9TQN4_BIOOC|nr:unnamed protein product [Clonostachys rosea f. rosea IK726]
MAGDPTPLASLSVTHVYYDPQDPISLFCAYLALLPQALCVVYATLIWSTREVEIGLTFAGQLACEALNFALKRLIKEERPAAMHGKGYGMPSSHAQFVAFWSVSLGLFLLVRHKPSKAVDSRAPSSAHTPWYTGWLRWGLETPIARAFRLRDLVVEEDPCQSGWEKWEERRVTSDLGKPKTN